MIWSSSSTFVKRIWGGHLQEDAATLRAAGDPQHRAPRVMAYLFAQLPPEAIEEAYEGVISLETDQVVPVLLTLAQHQPTPPNLNARLAELILYHTGLSVADQVQAIEAMAPYASVAGALAVLDQRQSELASAEQSDWEEAYDALASQADLATQRALLARPLELPRTRAQVRQHDLKQRPAVAGSRPRRRS